MRPKNKANQALPPLVTCERGVYYHRKGKGPRTRLGRRGEVTMADLWRKAERIGDEGAGTLRWLLERYHRGQHFARLADGTRYTYGLYIEQVCGALMDNGRTFGECPLGAIDTPLLRQYLDRFEEKKTTGNRHIQYLGGAFTWGNERGLCSLVKLPKLYTLKPRTRYVTDEEYLAVLEFALGREAFYLAPAMEIAYICRARRSEVLALTVDDLTDRGVYLRRGKGSTDEVTLWSPALVSAVEHCEKQTGAGARHVIHNARGEQVNGSAFRLSFDRMMNAAIGAGVIGERFTFHDLKAKGITDADHHSAGHRSEKMRAVYMRKAEEIKGTY